MRMKSSPKLRPNGWDGLLAAVVLALAVAGGALFWTGGGDAGGRVVAAGTVEEIKACPESVTGRFL